MYDDRTLIDLLSEVWRLCVIAKEHRPFAEGARPFIDEELMGNIYKTLKAANAEPEAHYGMKESRDAR